jgi:hypothetical protein
MKKANQIISCPDFLKLLMEYKGRISDPSLIVQGGYLTISGKEIGSDTLHIEGVTFTDMVTINGFEKQKISMGLNSSNFLDILCIEGNSGRHISISGVKAKHINLWRCAFESAFLGGIEVAGDLDISGLELTRRLTLDECSFSSLELIHQSSENTIKTPMVKTNDPLVAEQFRLIGVPVFMSTEAVRAMMENKAAKRRTAA